MPRVWTPEDNQANRFDTKAKGLFNYQLESGSSIWQSSGIGETPSHTGAEHLLGGRAREDLEVFKLHSNSLRFGVHPDWGKLYKLIGQLQQRGNRCFWWHLLWLRHSTLIQSLLTWLVPYHMEDIRQFLLVIRTRWSKAGGTEHPAESGASDVLLLLTG